MSELLITLMTLMTQILNIINFNLWNLRHRVIAASVVQTMEEERISPESIWNRPCSALKQTMVGNWHCLFLQMHHWKKHLEQASISEFFVAKI
ncbi:MAG TPA: hypothetical protein VK469_20700 [Candidatus Kapabacteria bacterium]|nr:hypothetical protein [Candidatus Kapabacteria bacterium]